MVLLHEHVDVKVSSVSQLSRQTWEFTEQKSQMHRRSHGGARGSEGVNIFHNLTNIFLTKQLVRVFFIMYSTYETSLLYSDYSRKHVCLKKQNEAG